MTRKKNKQNMFRKIIGGEILKEDFVIKQFKLMLLIAFCSIALVSHRYSCQQKLTQIEALNRKLSDVRYENIVLLTELTMNSRQSLVEDLLKKRGMDLSPSKSPVYEIYK